MTGERVFDLQVHTRVSPCSAASPRAVVEAALERGLDGIAITDHDTLAGVDAVRERAPAHLEVVPGVEVTTTQGHLLALGVSDPPPKSDPLRVVEDVHAQGGVAILSHPFDRLRESYDADLPAVAEAADGAEVVNSRCLRSRYNDEARRFAAAHGLSPTGGSDAHFPMEVGRARTVLEGDLLRAIRRGETRAEGRGGYVSGHVATKLTQVLSGRVNPGGRADDG